MQNDLAIATIATTKIRPEILRYLIVLLIVLIVLDLVTIMRNFRRAGQLQIHHAVLKITIRQRRNMAH